MFFLCCGPSAKVFDVDQIQLGKLISIFGEGIWVPGPVEVFACKVLGFRRVEVFQIIFRQLLVPMLDRVFDNDCDRGFRQNAGRGDHNFSLAGELFSDEVSLIFPSEVDVTDVPLHKGDGRTSGSGIENRGVLVQLFDELLDFDRIVVELFLGISPGGEVVPAGTSRSFRVGGHDGHPVRCINGYNYNY